MICVCLNTSPPTELFSILEGSSWCAFDATGMPFRSLFGYRVGSRGGTGVGGIPLWVSGHGESSVSNRYTQWEGFGSRPTLPPTDLELSLYPLEVGGLVQCGTFSTVHPFVTLPLTVFSVDLGNGGRCPSTVTRDEYSRTWSVEGLRTSLRPTLCLPSTLGGEPSGPGRWLEESLGSPGSGTLRLSDPGRGVLTPCVLVGSTLP